MSCQGKYQQKHSGQIGKVGFHNEINKIFGQLAAQQFVFQLYEDQSMTDKGYGEKDQINNVVKRSKKNQTQNYQQNKNNRQQLEPIAGTLKNFRGNSLLRFVQLGFCISEFDGKKYHYPD